MAANFVNLNSGAQPEAASSRVYTELRIHTQLLCEIYRVLTTLLGPNPVLAANGPQQVTVGDLSSDVDAWRNDPTFQGP